MARPVWYNTITILHSPSYNCLLRTIVFSLTPHTEARHQGHDPGSGRQRPPQSTGCEPPGALIRAWCDQVRGGTGEFCVALEIYPHRLQLQPAERPKWGEKCESQSVQNLIASSRFRYFRKAEKGVSILAFTCPTVALSSMWPLKGAG